MTYHEKLRGENYPAGHYDRGSDANHFAGLCGECDAHYLSLKTLEEVENWYHQGIIGQDALEAYHYVWATSAFRYGYYPAWETKPTDPEVLRMVEIMQADLAARQEASTR